MATPKVSVIVPVYNPGEWLHECLQSVLGQDVDGLEVICIDDGSTDDSLLLLREYASKDVRVKVFTQPNSGAAVARNKGLSIATGEFVTFMDPDDLYPNAQTLSTLCDKAVSHGVDACGGCMMQFFPDGRKIEHYSGLNFGYEFTTEGIVEYSDYQFEYGYTRFVYRRKVIEDNGIRFPELLRFQDPPFFVAVMQAVKRFYALPLVTYCYRATDQGKKVDWKGNDFQRARHYVRGMTMLLELASKHGLDKLRVREMERLFGGGGKFLWQEHIAEHIYDDLDRMMGEYMPTVSVVIPVYNVEKFVGECLDSVLSQKYRNLEVICVNDGSTDNSLQVVESYRSRFSGSCRLIVKSQKNGGLSAARNAGLDVATGKYIYFLDSDDTILPEAIGELVALCERENLDQVIFSSDVFADDEGESFGRQVVAFCRYYTLPNELCGRTMSGAELFNALVKVDRFHASQPLRFYRLATLSDHACRFPVGMLHEDTYFAPLSLRYAVRAMAINRRYYRRRVRAESIMTSTVDYSPRLHGLFGVIIKLCATDDLWNCSESFQFALRRFISSLTRGLGWNCRDTPREKWPEAVKDVVQTHAMGNYRIATEFILPLLNDRVVEYARANRAEKKVAELTKAMEEVPSLRQLIAAKDARIDDLEKRFKSRMKELVAANQLIVAKDKRIDDYEARIKLRTKEVAQLKKSFAYRVGMVITWPVRAIKHVLMGIAQK